MAEKSFDQVGFTEHLSEGHLMATRCESCGGVYLPPRSLCPACYGEELTWIQLSGKGELAAFTTIHIAPSAMIAAGYGRKNPYCAGVVRLAEGPAISAQILGVDAARPQDITIGTPLQATFIERGEGEEKKTFLAFQAV